MRLAGQHLPDALGKRGRLLSPAQRLGLQAGKMGLVLVLLIGRR